MTEQLVIDEEQPNKSLEQSAIEMGLLDENGNEPQPSPEATDDTDRPEWLPEKFESPEAMAKAYAELEARQSRSKGQQEASEETPSQESARETVEQAGVDFDALSKEYFDNAGLTEDSYKKLEDAGIPRNLVDQFISGQEAVSAGQRDAVLNEVGGESKYSEMTAWAADNFSEGEIDAFNSTLESQNPAAVRMAVAGLKARFEADQSNEPQRMVSGDGTRNAVYRSTAELMKDMNDPRYHNDPAFRSDVVKKLERSEIM